MDADAALPVLAEVYGYMSAPVVLEWLCREKLTVVLDLLVVLDGLEKFSVSLCSELNFARIRFCIAIGRHVAQTLTYHFEGLRLGLRLAGDCRRSRRTKCKSLWRE